MSPKLDAKEGAPDWDDGALGRLFLRAGMDLGNRALEIPLPPPDESDPRRALKKRLGVPCWAVAPIEADAFTAPAPARSPQPPVPAVEGVCLGKSEHDGTTGAWVAKVSGA